MINNLVLSAYYALVTGKQKAIVGFFVSSVLSGLAQFGLSGDMTLKEVLTSIGIGIVTHVSVYAKQNKA